MTGTFKSSSTSEHFCVLLCPTGYTSTGAPDCVVPSTLADQLILSYDFNAPLETYVNVGSQSGSFDLTPVRVNPSGHPARNRGLYFNGTDHAYITIGSLVLSHTFSVHTWALMKANNTDMTIFSKDRNVFTSGTSKQLLDLSVSSTNNMSSALSQDFDSSIVST